MSFHAAWLTYSRAELRRALDAGDILTAAYWRHELYLVAPRLVHAS